MHNYTAGLSVALCLILLESCVLSNQPSEFKSLKATSDTLTLFEPYVGIVAYRLDSLDELDRIGEKNRKVIFQTAEKILRHKYKVVVEQTPEVNSDSLFALFQRMDSLKLQCDVSIHSACPEISFVDKDHLAVLLCFQGIYDAAYEPYENSDVIYIDKVVSGLPKSALRILVVNLRNGNVIFYDRIKLNFTDPRVPDRAEEMTKKIIQAVYY